jgi:hypothetical protein
MSMLLNRQPRGGDGNLADPVRTAGVEEKIDPNESNRFRKIVAMKPQPVSGTSVKI